MILTDTLKQKQEEHGETLVRLNSGIKVGMTAIKIIDIGIIFIAIVNIAVIKENISIDQKLIIFLKRFFSSGERGEDQEQLCHF